MRTVRHIAAFVLLAGAAAGLTLYGWQSFRPVPTGPPVLDYQADVDLGPQEFGSHVVGRFRVDNRGGSELLLSRFGTSCSCAGVEVDQDGAPRRVEELRVPAGGHVDLSVRIAVGVQPGMPQTVFVKFTTTDPIRPEAAVRVMIPRVTGGLTAEPSAVVFGEIPTGRPAAKIVRLYSNGTANRRVHAVRSLQPDRFEVRLLSPEPTSDSDRDANRLVAVVEVVAHVDRPGRLDGTVEIVLTEESRASDRIAVLGEVVPPIVARPSALVLPRHVGDRPVYSGRVVLTGRDGAEFDVITESVPDGLTAVVGADPDNPGQWLLDVAVKPDGRAARMAVVRLRGTVRMGETSTVEVPVTIIPENS